MKPPWQKLCKSKFIMPIILLSCATAWPAESLKDKARFLHHFDSDSIPIRFDCHASRSMGFAADQFVGPVTPMRGKVKGIGKTEITGVGTLQVSWEDDMGRSHTHLIKNSLLVPALKEIVVSPQHWAQSAQDNRPNPRGTWCATYEDCIEVFWDQRRFKRTIFLQKEGSNVPVIYSTPGNFKFNSFCAQCNFEGESSTPQTEFEYFDAGIVTDDEGEEELSLEDQSTSSESATMQQESEESKSAPSSEPSSALRTTPIVQEVNLDGPNGPTIVEDEEFKVPDDLRKAFLKWHHRLAHLPYNRIRLAAKLGIIPTKLAQVKDPIPCTACLYGKATRKPWRTKAPPSSLPKSQVHKPGDCVFIDQSESSTPGLIAQLKGKPTKERYRGTTVFVDAFSDLTHTVLMRNFTAGETLKAKHAFEAFARSHRVTVKHYHADNGCFAENAFRQDLEKQGQTISFCGVNAHFQNGVVEKRIRDLQDPSRTMLLHAKNRWPKAIDTYLWPYAMRMATDVHNHMPTAKAPQTTPMAVFSGSEVNVNSNHLKHFGCPAYVLDSALATGRKIQKWKQRSRMGIFLGLSPVHARSVPLVLSMTTGLVSPQFHVVLDPTFSTITNTKEALLPESKWQQQCGFISKPADPDVKYDEPTVRLSSKQRRKEWWTRKLSERQDGQIANLDFEDAIEDQPFLHDGLASDRETSVAATSDVTPTVNEVSTEKTTDNTTNLRRSARLREQREKDKVEAEAYAAQQLSIVCKLLETSSDTYLFDNNDFSEIELDYMAATAANPDVLTYHEAMRAPDRKEFLKAMDMEVNGLEENENWRVIPKSAVPNGQQVLPAVWAFRRKRRIATGKVYKWKARLNIHGGRQTKNVNFWETYAPVASWPIVRWIIILYWTLGWSIRQIDFVQAYTQAPTECDMYMEIPRGFQVNGSRKEHVLFLQKNIYGAKQAGRLWNQHMISKLLSIGFHQSNIDPCILYYKHSVLVVYVDDTILTGPDDKELTEIETLMKKANLKLTSGNYLEDFLGVEIKKGKNGKLLFTQPQLIDSILKDLNLGPKSNTHDTPAALTTVLQPHVDSEAHKAEDFDYRSVIGKLLYLEKSTRPDLAYAVHQCARFSSNPKKEHTKAVKHIGRYLLATKDKGLEFSPNLDHGLECFADSDFAGNWTKDHADSDNTSDMVRSRSGFVIMFAGCPIHWASRLQSTIALSSCEAEYVSLSTALREVIPLIDLAKEMRERKTVDIPATSKIKCKAFEDNSGALEMAKVPKLRPRTCHIAVAMHHFCDQTDPEKGDITLHAIDSADNVGDMFTKQSSRDLYKRHRKEIMGW